MLIIGEKINGTRPEVAQAVADRDTAVIQDLARRQTEAGSHWLDVNAGTPPDQEPDDLVWLVETIQSAVDTPLCLDSANSQALAAAMSAAAVTPMINSVSGSQESLQQILPLVARYGGSVIALLLDENGIPMAVNERVAVARRIIQTTRAQGIPDENVYFDPITLTIASTLSGARTTLDTMRFIKQEIPRAKLSVGLSNVSFGLPNRHFINRTYLSMALCSGLDAAILDPLDQELQMTIMAAQALLGQDKYGVKYIRSFRSISR